MNKFNPNLPYNDLPLLPPKKEHIETIELLKQENKAVRAISELKGMAHIIPNQEILINAIILQEAQDSSEIENIVTTQDELYKAAADTVTKTDPATKEVIFYREALYEGFKKIKGQGFLTMNDIIDLQKIIVQNDAGIRKTSGTALVNDKNSLTIYTPPSGEEKLNFLTTNLIKYLNDPDESLTKMAILHYQFETIHPFYDGNGRTGRIINILYLILKGYLDIPILYLSSYIIKNKEEYYKLLLEVTINEKWEEWILYILRGIQETAEETKKKIIQIKENMDHTIELIKKRSPKIYSKELVETLYMHPYCTVEILGRFLGYERKAASRHLHTLADNKILSFHKIGRYNIFINDSLMEILRH